MDHANISDQTFMVGSRRHVSDQPLLNAMLQMRLLPRTEHRVAGPSTADFLQTKASTCPYQPATSAQQHLLALHFAHTVVSHAEEAARTGPKCVCGTPIGSLALGDSHHFRVPLVKRCANFWYRGCTDPDHRCVQCLEPSVESCCAARAGFSGRYLFLKFIENQRNH